MVSRNVITNLGLSKPGCIVITPDGVNKKLTTQGLILFAQNYANSILSDSIQSKIREIREKLESGEIIENTSKVVFFIYSSSQNPDEFINGILEQLKIFSYVHESPMIFIIVGSDVKNPAKLLDLLNIERERFYKNSSNQHKVITFILLGDSHYGTLLPDIWSWRIASDVIDL